MEDQNQWIGNSNSALFLFDSKLDFKGDFSFLDNRGDKGGAIQMNGNSKVCSREGFLPIQDFVISNPHIIKLHTGMPVLYISSANVLPYSRIIRRVRTGRKWAPNKEMRLLS